MMTRVKCPSCGLYLSTKSNLRRHARTYHNLNLCRQYKHSFVCSVCSDTESATFKNRVDFFKHLKQAHDCDVQTDTLTFSSSEKFHAWKERFEVEDKNRFSVVNRCKSTKADDTIIYSCHRSGFFKSGGTGIRRMKTMGSKKINGYCPARIKCVQRSDGQHDVTVTRAHWGHSDEIAHCYLSPNERQFLAERIASKISFPEILNEIKMKANKVGAFRRLHLVTAKDLHNISARSDRTRLKSSMQDEDLIEDDAESIRDNAESIRDNAESIQVCAGSIQGSEGSIQDDAESIEDDAGSIIFPEDNRSIVDDEDIIIGQRCDEDSSQCGIENADSVEQTKNRLFLTIAALINEVKHMNSFEDLELVENLVEPIESMLAALREERTAKSNFDEILQHMNSQPKTSR